MIKTLFITFLVLFFNWGSLADDLTLDDVSRLNETKINRIIRVQDSSHIQEGLIYAIKHRLKVSIAGKRHSQGGHVVYKNGVVLDMTDFDKILDINPKKTNHYCTDRYQLGTNSRSCKSLWSGY